jgi:two-component system, NtrC family, nitrogen regulation sensor histidine kinase GlnL
LAARPTPAPVVTLPAPQPPWGDVLASIQDAVFVIDRRGCIEDVNPAAEQLTGISAAHASGVEIGVLLRASPWIGEMARGTLGEGAARRRSEGTLARGRSDVPVAAACAPWIDADGGLRGAVLVLHDLSLQQSLEATTRRADRLAALGTVALGLAHEIRNPLGGIKGAAQLIRGAVADPETIRCTEIIIREVERLDGLIEQLRELSTPPRLLLEAVNIHRVLNDVLALQRQASSWGGVTLRTVFDPSLPAVHGDRAQLTQVFLNLVKNALEALGGTGELCVSTLFDTRFHVRRGSGRGRFLSVLIEDTGPGIAEDHQAQLFSPFFSTKARGTGLGLALCHRIVTEHGGTIAYETRPAGGASFRVTLRVSEDEHR